MAHQEQSVGADLVRGPAHSHRTVFDERGEANFRIEAIVGDDDRDAPRSERLGDKKVVALRAGIPIAAIEEDDRLAIGAWCFRFV
jgi:hypothetical protein